MVKKLNRLKRLKGKVKKVILGIGTNKGDRKKNIALALKLLDESNSTNVLKISRMLKNPPEEGVRGGYFLNGAVLLLTSLSPLGLFKLCKEIEKRMGRKRIGETARRRDGETAYRRIGELANQQRKTSRTIDLDILFYEDKIMRTKNLKIPHPMLHKRYFVLIPLMDIAKSYVHPIFKKTIRELYTDKHEKLSKRSVKV